jgi:hypothetical protein
MKLSYMNMKGIDIFNLKFVNLENDLKCKKFFKIKYI